MLKLDFHGLKNRRFEGRRVDEFILQGSEGVGKKTKVWRLRGFHVLNQHHKLEIDFFKRCLLVQNLVFFIGS